jgi:hypothetical protein
MGQLSSNELSVLEGVFWLHGPSRDALSQRLALLRTHANATIAGMLEQGWLDRAGQRESEDRLFKRPFSFSLAPRTQQITALGALESVFGGGWLRSVGR